MSIDGNDECAATSTNSWTAKFRNIFQKKPDPLLGKSLASLGLKSAYSLLNLGTLILLARVLGPSDYGAYALALSLLSIVGILFEGGVSRVVMREVARGYGLQDWSLVSSVLRWSYRLIAKLSLIALLAIAAINAITHVGFSPSERVCLNWGLLFLPLLALNRVREGALLGLQRVTRAQIPESLVSPVLNVAMLLIVFYYHSLSASDAMCVRFVSICGSWALGSWLLREAIPVGTRTNPNIAQEKSWLSSTWNFAVLTGLFTINQQVDILMLRSFQGSEAVGIFRASMAVTTLLVFCSGAVHKVFEPMIAHSMNSDDREKVQALVTRGARLAFFPAAVIGLLTIVYGKCLIETGFGMEYSGAVEPLRLLASGYVIAFAIGDSSVILAMGGEERIVSIITFGALALNVGLNFLLIPHFGLVGTAAATTASKLLSVCCMSGYLWQSKSIKSWCFPHRSLVSNTD